MKAKIVANKAFSVGNAQVKEAFQKYILSYQRVGQYTDKSSNNFLFNFSCSKSFKIESK